MFCLKEPSETKRLENTKICQKFYSKAKPCLKRWNQIFDLYKKANYENFETFPPGENKRSHRLSGNSCTSHKKQLAGSKADWWSCMKKTECAPPKTKHSLFKQLAVTYSFWGIR